MGRPILTASAMAAAEQQAIERGASVEELMERAGAALAEAAYRFAGPRPTLVLAGPGNNGGDGYVAARRLAERGVMVRVAALAEPRSQAATVARSLWTGPVEQLSADTHPASLLIDALFGTGLKRGLERSVSQQVSNLCAASTVSVACDLPSGADSDTGALLSPVAQYSMTIALGALKPSHLLYPAAGHMGRLVLADIGIGAVSALSEIERPDLPSPSAADHKYSRGYVALLAGEMPGAIALCASAAARAGAGYVRLISSERIVGVPHAIVQSGSLGLLADDDRIDVVVAGPGLGRGPEAKAAMDALFGARRRMVLDADALHWASGNRQQLGGTILTPHDGEFDAMFAIAADSRLERARRASQQSSAVIVLKGAATIVAAPDGRAAIARPAPHWLASAGTGDVLSGIVGALLAAGLDRFEAACGAVWLHSRAAEIAGPALIADDLLDALPLAVAECL